MFVFNIQIAKKNKEIKEIISKKEILHPISEKGHILRGEREGVLRLPPRFIMTEL